MRIFKPMYKQDGKAKECGRFYLQLRDHNKQVRRYRGFASKSSTAELGKMIEKLIRYKIANTPLDVELLRFIEGTDPMLKEQFIRHGIIELKHLAGGVSLKNHLEAFVRMMTTEGRSKTHIEGTQHRIEKILNGCKFLYLKDVSSDKLIRFLDSVQNERAELVEVDNADNTGKKKTVLKPVLLTDSTRNHYLTAFKMFLNWLVEDGRADKNPLGHMKKRPASAEQRGALTREQFETLIKTTMQGGMIRHMTGYERGMLYLLAGSTGYRRNELLTLRWKDFIFGDNNAVNVDGGRTKNHKDASQPIPKPTAVLFAQWKVAQDATATDKVFPNFTTNDRPADMIKADLTTAELPIKDYADRPILFHSLRNSYISFLAESNAPLKLIQELARHSDPRLTFGTYARITSASSQAAADALPTINVTAPKKNQAEYLKTGTYDSVADSLCSKLAPKGGEKEVNGGKCGQNMVKSEVAQNAKEPAFGASITHFQPENANTPGRIRTYDLRIRNPLLYPAELRAPKFITACNIISCHQDCQTVLRQKHQKYIKSVILVSVPRAISQNTVQYPAC